MSHCMQGVVTALDALAGVSTAAASAAHAGAPSAASPPLYRGGSASSAARSYQASHPPHAPPPLLPGGAVTQIQLGHTMPLRRASSSPPAYYLRYPAASHACASSFTEPTASPAPKRPRTSHRMRFLRARELDTHTYTCTGDSSFSAAASVPEELRTWIEGETLRKLDVGEYVTLDKNAERVRSTISIALSHDGRYFASTHGDHSVKVFEYPSRIQIACLDGHPRTPWTVCFHPSDSNLVASGCLGSECRVWNVKAKKCIRKHTFKGSISCVSFNPSGELLAVTSGKSLLLWNYNHPTPNGTISSTTPPPTAAAPRAGPANAPPGPARQEPNITANRNGNRTANNNPPNPVRNHDANEQAINNTPLIQTTYLPVELLAGSNPFHMVDFHPSGHMLMTGEKNKNTTIPANNGEEQPPEEQFTLKIILHRFDRRMGVKFAPPVLIVPRVVAYNDAGIHFSPCGKMLAACVPVAPSSQSFHIAVLSIYPTAKVPVGSVLYKSPLDKGHVTALTNLKFSSTSKHLLAGFSFRPQNPVLRIRAEQYGEMAMAAGRNNNSRRNNNNGEGDERLLFAACGAPFEARVPQVRVVDIYRVDAAFKRIRSLGADMDITENNGGAEDEINVAVFAPNGDGLADGIIYGTQKGRIRMFQQASGRKGYPPGICDANCAVDYGSTNSNYTCANNNSSNHGRLGYILQPLNSSGTMEMAANANMNNNNYLGMGNNANNNVRWRYSRQQTERTSYGAPPLPHNNEHIHNQIRNNEDYHGQVEAVMPLGLPRIAQPPHPHPPLAHHHNNNNRAQSAPAGLGTTGVFLEATYRRETAWTSSNNYRQNERRRSGILNNNTSAMAQPSMMINPHNLGGIVANNNNNRYNNINYDHQYRAHEYEGYGIEEEEEEEEEEENIIIHSEYNNNNNHHQYQYQLGEERRIINTPDHNLNNNNNNNFQEEHHHRNLAGDNNNNPSHGRL